MQIVNTPKPIEWKTFDAFAARAGLEGEDYRLFLQIMREMDDEYLDVMAKKAKGISADDDDDETGEDE